MLSGQKHTMNLLISIMLPQSTNHSSKRASLTTLSIPIAIHRTNSTYSYIQPIYDTTQQIFNHYVIIQSLKHPLNTNQGNNNHYYHHDTLAKFSNRYLVNIRLKL